jgi:dethiobiotin synthetase
LTSHQAPTGPGGLFVTGTDTGVGKTRIACALLRTAAGTGWRAVGMKPLASGALPDAGGLRNEDVERLLAASNVAAPRELVSPYCFEPAIAPHLAAAEAGLAVNPTHIAEACSRLRRLADLVVVEGAGGLLVPIGQRLTMADLARLLALPIVLVVGMRLGCLNHAMLTCESIERRGLRLAGWVANCIDPAMLRLEANVDALRARVSAPLLAVVPYDPDENAPAVLDMAALGLASRR